ncbi:MAG: hypothetical protein KME23_12865 [Goleter apudmare HA4340-LM2]|nr:hypothetical protein [Goleter apudmare HA4340-LM2]
MAFLGWETPPDLAVHSAADPLRVKQFLYLVKPQDWAAFTAYRTFRKIQN